MTLLIDLFLQFIDIFLHLDQHLVEWITFLGPTIYLVLFIIIFAETGLVVTPFLPGDSLLFAAGALTVFDGGLDLKIILITLSVAGVLGDGVNYHIGKYLGPKVFSEQSKFFKTAYLIQTQDFYNRWGSFTIVAARFAPIIRTFAPFVAGVAGMNYRKFFSYNVVGGIAWVFIFTLAGHFFGNLPMIKRNFQFVIFAIIFVSILPFIIKWVQFKLSSKKA